MDVNVKLTIIAVAAFVLLALLVDAWFRERRFQSVVESINEQKDKIEHQLTYVTHTLRSEIADFKVEPSVSSETAYFHQDAVMHPKVKPEPNLNTEDDFIVINVIAKNNETFSSYDLLQAISATGMQYGAMNIFHFVEDTPSGKQTLFSLASATEPGEFDLNNIGDLSCAGLTLFMNISKVSDPGDVFILMLETAEQLADDLNGELKASPNTQWTDEVFHYYESKILNQQKLI